MDKELKKVLEKFGDELSKLERKGKELPQYVDDFWQAFTLKIQKDNRK